jgi:hypothetical protein
MSQSMRGRLLGWKLAPIQSLYTCTRGQQTTWTSWFAIRYSAQISSSNPFFLQIHEPRTEINGPYTYQLGLDLTDSGDIRVSGPLYTTTVPSVFAVGDCACATKDVLQAMATGALAAKGVSAELAAEL